MKELEDRQKRYERFSRLVSAITTNKESLEQLKKKCGAQIEEVQIYEEVIQSQLRLLKELKEK